MKLLLIEDDDDISAMVRCGFEELGHGVTIGETGEKGLSLAMSQEFDAILLDLMLADLDGFSILREIRKNNNPTPVIVVSARQSVQDKVYCLNEGSDDYLTKPFSFMELVARVNAVVRRKATKNGAVRALSLFGLEMDMDNRRVLFEGAEIVLQPKEFALLRYLMENAGTVVSRAMIMSNVWGYDFDPGTKILDVHISHLREKLYNACGIKLIHTVRGCGYVFRQEA